MSGHDGVARALDPDEKELVVWFERGEWKPTTAVEVDRMRELARQQLGADVRAGFDWVLGEGRTDDYAGGPSLAPSESRHAVE